MSDKLLESINRKLEVIVALLLKKRFVDVPLLKEQIKVLNDLGLTPKEIGKILGRSNTYVNKELSDLRKNRKLKKYAKK